MMRYEAYELATMLMAAFPAARTHEGTADVYASMLTDLGYEATHSAVKALMAESRYMPTIAEIRDRVASDTVQAKSPDLAWGEVLRAVGRYGIYRRPEFEDPCTAIAVSNIGWRQICNADESQHGTMRAQFRRAYEAALEIAKREHNADRLLEHADQRRLAGLHDDEPEASPSGEAVRVSDALTVLPGGRDGE